jgi:hypothetical protein
VSVEEGWMSAVYAQALPHAVPEDESCIEHRDDRRLARYELSVDVDEYVGIAVVLDVLMCAVNGLLGHFHRVLSLHRQAMFCCFRERANSKT